MSTKNGSNGANNNANTTRTTNGTKGKQYNPTVTAFFRNDKFGLKDRDTGEIIPNTAFVSSNIDAAGFKTLQQHSQIGSKFVLRMSGRRNKNGGETWYLEVLPPLVDTTSLSNRGRNSQVSNGSAEDDI